MTNVTELGRHLAKQASMGQAVWAGTSMAPLKKDVHRKWSDIGGRQTAVGQLWDGQQQAGTMNAPQIRFA